MKETKSLGRTLDLGLILAYVTSSPVQHLLCREHCFRVGSFPGSLEKMEIEPRNEASLRAGMKRLVCKAVVLKTTN